MSTACPFCAGTDITSTTNGQGYCLDCDRLWTPGGKKTNKNKKSRGRGR